MKVRASVKPMCDGCKVIKRDGKVMVICPKSAKNIILLNASSSDDWIRFLEKNMTLTKVI